MDLVSNNLQMLICHKTQPTKPTNRGVVANVLVCDIVVSEFEL